MTNAPETRRTHVIRILGTNPTGDVLSDIWLDVERIDVAKTVTQTGNINWQGQQRSLKWNDDPAGSDGGDGTGNPARKVITVKVCSPDEPDQTDPTEWVPVDVIQYMKMQRGDQGRQDKFLSDPDNDLTSARVVEVRKISHWDTSIDDAAQAAFDADPTLKVYVAQGSDYSLTDGTKDDSQYVEHEVITYLKSLNTNNEFTAGQGVQQGQQVKMLNQYLIDQTDPSPGTDDTGPNGFDPPWRLDPYQNIVNLQLGSETEFEPNSDMSLDNKGDDALSISISLFIFPTQEAIDGGATIYEWGYEGTDLNGPHPGPAPNSIVLNNDGTITFNFASPLYPPTHDDGYGSSGGTFPYEIVGLTPSLGDYYGVLGGYDVTGGLAAEKLATDAALVFLFSFETEFGPQPWAYVYQSTGPLIGSPDAAKSFNYVISSNSTGKVIADQWNHVMVATKFSVASVTTTGDATADPPVLPIVYHLDSAPVIVARVNDKLDTDNTSISLLGQVQTVPAGSVLPSVAYEDGTRGNIQWYGRSPATVTATFSGADPKVHVAGHVGVPVPAWDIVNQTYKLGYAALEMRSQFIDPTDRANVDLFMKVNPNPSPDNKDLYMMVRPTVARNPTTGFGLALFELDGGPSRFVKNANGTDGGPFTTSGTLKSRKGPKIAP